MSDSERFVMITDSRLGITSDGSTGTSDPGLIGDGWKRGLAIPNMVFAARVDPRIGSALEPMTGQVCSLPYHVGLLQFVKKLPHTAFRILRLVRASDVVVSRVPGLLGLLTTISAVLSSRPLALEVVGDPRDSISGIRLRDRLLAWFGVRATRWAVLQADAVRYVTQTTLQSSFPAKTSAVTVAFSSVQSAFWFTAPKFPGSMEPLILAVGSQQQMYKGHDLLIRALPEIRRRVPGAKLALIGSGRMQAQLKSLAAEVGVAPFVEFVGQLSDRREVLKRVDAAWVFAMPSRAEGLPRALVEAMARGKACVGTRVGGIPELLPEESLVDVDDISGLVDAISALLSSEPLRRARGEESLRRVGAYHPKELELRASQWTSAVRRLA